MQWKGVSMVPFLVVLLLSVISDVKGEDAGARSNKYINVGVVSNWGSTPLHMEASEYFSEESASLFWQFVDGISGAKQNTPEALYKQSLETAEKLVSKDRAKLLKLSLALRTYSPKIEMYRQLSKMLDSHSTGAIHVLVGSSVITSTEVLEKTLANLGESTAELFEFDHVYPTAHNHTKHAILYADIADSSFSAYHKILSKAAEQGKIGYVLRHLVPESSTKINLQGWGVDLAIKNVEYKAMDDSKVAKETDAGDASVSGIEEDEDLSGFRIGVLKKRKPELAQQLDDFSTFLMRKNVKVDELNVWDFKDMGLQASQKVVTGSDPLKALRDISQNFPSLAGPLTRLKQNSTLKQEIYNNQNRLGEGENLVLMNGRIIDPENVDAFAFLNVLKEEVSKIDDLQKLKLDLPSILPFVSTPLPDKTELRFKVDSPAIIYANDLENDNRYDRWPKHASDFMRRVYPGQMRFVARNFFTIIFMADFATEAAIDGILTLHSLINQNLPARVGFLPLPLKDNPASVQIAKILRYVAEKNGDRTAFGLLVQLQQSMRGLPSPISVETLAGLYNSYAPNYGLDSWSVVSTSAEAEQKLQVLQEFTESLGLDSQQMFINGLLSDPNKELLEAISEAMNDQTPFLQSLVHQGRIHDGTNIYQFLMNPPDFLAHSMNIVQRFNKFVPPSDKNPLQIVPLIGAGVGTASEGEWASLTKPEKTSRVLSRLSYVESNKDDVKKYSHLLFVDVSTVAGVNLALAAVNFAEISKLSRVALILNPAKAPTGDISAIEDAILKAGSNLGVVKALLEAQLKALGDSSALNADSISKVVEESRKGKKLPKLSQEPRELLVQGQWWAQNVAEIPAGASAVLINGRKIVLSGPFVAKDFAFLELFQDMRYGKLIDLLLREPKFAGVDPDDLTSSFLSTVVMQAVSRLSLDEQSGVSKKSLSSDLKISAVQSTSEDPTLVITAILDPLSKASQKFSPILLTLRKLFAVRIQLILNPRLQLSDLPLKRYYHYLFTDEIEFDESGQEVPSNSATLSQLPLSRILTLGMDTPEAWLVQPIIARYDLDNIKLEDLGDEKVLTAVFELEYILVEGNCYDISSLHWGMPTPPRGLELVLQHHDPNMPSVDTLVMSNFGYFQLKANPGIWKLRLAEGRGTDIFSITKDTVQHADGDSSYRWVVVSSFLGEFVPFKVERKPGMAEAQLLVTEDEGSNNAWDAISGLWKSKDEKASKEPTTLHIFSVASGHLYERLTRIMMLSVIKQTKNPVKFWFLKNYMSPKFKEIIPHMAKEYNFEYELVTYKWPSWLRKQTEKQRIIWAYKILFLDVLFPLGVKKIIFVDSDQVVRTDMMNLYNMNLEGAPLAYTPFCNNKPEMDGFRFWKAGYWKDHLRGKPYHISALYVIDLQQFRRTAAGDQLRSTYDMLSRDPNSLANLDQDLPNYLQHNVKIFSLPQEWLWCETWCPEETKSKAKTIDLCNNPLTKASKLENAVRILGDEWISLDNEVKDLEQRILENKSTPSTSTHPHSSHTTHADASAEKINEAYNKLKLEL